jgi:hypothetical protein
LYRNKHKHSLNDDDDDYVIDESSALVVMPLKPNNIILMIIDDICDEVILKEGKLMTIKVTNSKVTYIY